MFTSNGFSSLGPFSSFCHFLGKLPGKNAVTNLKDTAVWDSLMRLTMCVVIAACTEVEMLN